MATGRTRPGAVERPGAKAVHARRSVFLEVLLVLVLAALASCRARDSQIAPVFDPDYLSPGVRGDAATFTVVFVEYSQREAGVVEDAWRETAAPGEKTASLWGGNGLRIALADAATAKKVWEVLKRARDLKYVQRVAVMPFDKPFELNIGPTVERTGLAYTTSDATVYKDVANMQFAVNMQVLGDKRGPRVSVSPLILTGADPVDPLKLKGLDAEFPFEKGAIVLVGPVENPAELRLGSFLYRSEPAGGRGTLVIVEMDLS